MAKIARQLACVGVVLVTLAGPGLCEELDCRWFIPASGTTVPVRCDDAHERAASVAAQVVQSGKALLGLTLEPLTQELKNAYGIAKTISGVLVTKVDLNSEAEERGITRGDVILATDRETISTPEEMAHSVEAAAKDGRKAISLLLSKPAGETQLVSLSL